MKAQYCMLKEKSHSENFTGSILGHVNILDEEWNINGTRQLAFNLIPKTPQYSTVYTWFHHLLSRDVSMTKL